MAQVKVSIKYLVQKGSHAEIETKEAMIDTSARVDEFLEALKDKIALKGRTQQLYLSADPEEHLDSLGIREGDTIVIMPKNTDPIVFLS